MTNERHVRVPMVTNDGYVRVPITELRAIQLRPLFSQKDFSIVDSDVAGALITGITEWIGSWQDETISVGWDWGVVDGVVVLLSQNEIRTNILLIAEKGRPAARELCKIHLFDWIESLPWRELAVNSLLLDDHCLRHQH